MYTPWGKGCVSPYLQHKQHTLLPTHTSYVVRMWKGSVNPVIDR